MSFVDMQMELLEIIRLKQRSAFLSQHRARLFGFIHRWHISILIYDFQHLKIIKKMRTKHKDLIKNVKVFNK